MLDRRAREAAGDVVELVDRRPDRGEQLIDRRSGLGRRRQQPLEEARRPFDSIHQFALQGADDQAIATDPQRSCLAVDGVQIDDIETTGKTLPDFAGMWSRMLDS